MKKDLNTSMPSLNHEKKVDHIEENDQTAEYERNEAIKSKSSHTSNRSDEQIDKNLIIPAPVDFRESNMVFKYGIRYILFLVSK